MPFSGCSSGTVEPDLVSVSVIRQPLPTPCASIRTRQGPLVVMEFPLADRLGVGGVSDLFCDRASATAVPPPTTMTPAATATTTRRDGLRRRGTSGPAGGPMVAVPSATGLRSRL